MPVNDNPRVFVTGLGALTPLGPDVAALWDALLLGTEAVTTLDRFDLAGLTCTRGGQIRGSVPPAVILTAGPVDLATGFAAAACAEALRPLDAAARAATGLVAATNFGALDVGESFLAGGETLPPSQDRAFAAACCGQSFAAGRLAGAFGLGGPQITLSLSCAAGAAAVAHAAALIRSGRTERMLVVGFDALSRFAWSGLCALRTMTRDWVRPFDLNRAGTLFSEGAAALLLESAPACAARGGEPLAEVRGWATGNNGFHMTAPAPRGAGSAQVMRQALACAGLPPAAVDHINAHGTGTKPNDSTEAQAIADVFGDRAAQIPVTSIKASLGHMLGAAGTVEALVSVLTLRFGVIPPTTHFTTPDPECPVNLVANAPRAARVTCVLSNSAGIGGCNAAVLLTPPPSSHPPSQS